MRGRTNAITGGAIKAATGTGSRANAGAITVTGLDFQPDMVVLYGGSSIAQLAVRCAEVFGQAAYYHYSRDYESSSGYIQLQIHSLNADGFSAELYGWSGSYNYTWHAYKFS